MRGGVKGMGHALSLKAPSDEGNGTKAQECVMSLGESWY